MDRLLVVRCPALLDEDEGGAVLRTFARVVEAVEAYCPWVTPVRPGVCSLPARGPARYFGGEEALVGLVAAAADAVTGGGTAEVGIAEGLFAAVLAARSGCIVGPGATTEFLAPLPLDVLDHPELDGLLARLGIRTLGAFAALPEHHVLGRFGADGVQCHRVAGGAHGELDGLRDPACARRVADLRRGPADAAAPGSRQPGFWGGETEADTRAARALRRLGDLLGAEAVVVARLQGGRGPADRARFVTWDGTAPADTPDPEESAPWPGRIPPPAPALVHATPVAAEVVDDGGVPVSVGGRGLLSGTPARVSLAGGPWAPVTAWAGPWPV